ncbi:MAG TPA: acetate kinase, partial [Dehalococcoidia bacterium]|nr:acetate kinase [Dehalococcoidia bacterium]
MRVLALNCGSSSLKFDVLDVVQDEAAPAQRLATGEIDRIGAGGGTAKLSHGETTVEREIEAPDQKQAFAMSMSLLDEAGLAKNIEAVGHRVVHGGSRFVGPTLIDDEVIGGIEAASELAPLHNKPAL